MTLTSEFKATSIASPAVISTRNRITIAIMAHPDAFCVYATVDIDPFPLLMNLNHGISGDTRKWYPSSQSFINRPLSSIIHHHRSQPESSKTQYFIVVDRADWEAEGVVGVNLDFESFIDAARFKAKSVGSTIPSISIGTSDWSKVIRDVLNRPWIAVYADIWFDKGDAPDELLKALNFGLKSRKDTDFRVCGLVADYFVSTDDVRFVAKNHADIAAKGGYDPQLFIFADDTDLDDYGVIIARISADGSVDSCRKPVDVAAEVLAWVQVGLYTWQEAKEWDDEPQQIEQ